MTVELTTFGLKAELTVDDKQLEKGLNKAKERMRSFGKASAIALGTAATAGVVGLGVAISKGIGRAVDLKEAQQKVRAELDLTAKESAQLGKMAGTLYGQNYGQSMEDNLGALATVQGSLRGVTKLTQKELLEATKYASNFANTFEVEVGDSTRLVGQLIKNGLVKDSREGFDLITKAMQRVPQALRGDVLNSMTEYGPFMKSLGMNGQEAVSLFVNAAKEGPFVIDKMGDAFREFNIRAKDGSKGTTDVLKALNLDSKQIAIDLTKSGPVAGAAMKKVTSALAGVENPAKQARMAVALFGNPMEDLNDSQVPKFIRALNKGGDAMKKFRGSAKKMDTALSNTPAAKMEMLRRKVEVVMTKIGTALLPVVIKLVDYLNGEGGKALEKFGEWFTKTIVPVLEETGASVVEELIPAIKDLGDSLTNGAGKGFLKLLPLVAKFAGFLSKYADVIIPLVVWWKTYTTVMANAEKITKGITAATKLWGQAQAVFNAIMAVNPVILIVLALAALIAASIYLYKHSEKFKKFVDQLWAGLKAFGTWLKDVFVEAFHAVGDALTWLKARFVLAWQRGKEDVQNFWDALKRGFLKLVDAIASLLLYLTKKFKTAWERAKADVHNFWDGLKRGFSKVLEWVTWPFRKAYAWFKDHWKLVLGLLTGPIGLAVFLINKYWDRIKRAASSLWASLKDGVSRAAGYIQERFARLVGFFTRLRTRVRGVFKNVWDGIKETFKAAINTIIGLWNRISFSTPEITIPIPGADDIHVAGYKFSVPQIPALAKGGIVTRPTLALIGEAGPEKVIPLSKESQYQKDRGAGKRTMTVFTVGGREFEGYMEEVAERPVRKNTAHRAAAARMRGIGE